MNFLTAHLLGNSVLFHVLLHGFWHPQGVWGDILQLDVSVPCQETSEGMYRTTVLQVACHGNLKQ